MGGVLAPAGARRRALQARADRPGEDLDVGVRARGVEQRGEPAVAYLDVVVDEHDELAGGALDARVARGVQARAARGWG